jgi:hypothetical protein
LHPFNPFSLPEVFMNVVVLQWIAVLILMLAQTFALAAQVTAVGSYNVSLKPGLNLMGVQIDDGRGNTVSSLFEAVTNDLAVYKIVDGSFTTNLYSHGTWQRPDEIINPGEGCFVLNQNSKSALVSFAGTILQGDLTNTIPAGLSARCVMVPWSAKITDKLRLHLSPFDNMYLWTNGALQVFTYLPGGIWKPFEPTLGLGQAFLVNASKPIDWVIVDFHI